MQPWVNVGRKFYISKSKWADSNLFAKHHQPLFTSFECFSMECPTVIGHMTAEQEGGICWCWHDSMIMAEMANHPQAWKVAIHRQYAAYLANTNNLHHHLRSSSGVNDPLCVSASYIDGDATSMALVVVVMHILHDLPCTTDSRLKQHNDPRFTRSGPDK